MPRNPGSTAKPWSRAKAARRELTPDERWAADIRARTLASCHPWQEAAASDDARFFTWLVGRGGGKTSTFRARYVIGMSAIPRARFVYVAPTRDMASELLWDPLQSTCAELGIEATFKEVGKTVTFARTGARLRLFGAEDRREMNKLRGQPFDGVGVDEAALFEPDMLEWFVDRIIVPRLGERNGWIGLASTPGHILSGLFYEATRPGGPLHRPVALRGRDEVAGWNGWWSHAWSLRDVAQLPDAERRYPAIVANWRAALEMKARPDKQWGNDHPIWMREYLGIWAADNTNMVFRYRPHDAEGRAFNQWDPHTGRPLEGLPALAAALAKLPELPSGGRWHFVVALDMGHADPFACNVFAFSPTDPTRTIWHVFAFEQTGMYAKPIAELLLGAGLSTSKPEGIFGAIGWPDGMVMDADQALLEELGNVYGIRIAKAERKPDYKFGAIELCNGDLVEGRIRVIKGSPLEAQLQQLQWTTDDFSGRVREHKAQANHSTDCLLYGRRLIAAMFESGVVAAERPAQSRGYEDPMGLSVKDSVGGEFASLLSESDYDSMFGNE